MAERHTVRITLDFDEPFPTPDGQLTGATKVHRDLTTGEVTGLLEFIKDLKNIRGLDPAER